MVITSTARHKSNPDMVRIYIDGVYAFSMPEEDYLRLNLYEKRELTQAQVDDIQETVNIKLAKQRGIKMLSTKDRTAFEVHQRLVQQGFDDVVADGAVLQLKALGYINDRLFAHKFISDRLALKPQSKKALIYELQKKGVAQELIDEVVHDFELNDTHIAHRIAKKKYGKYDVTAPQIQRKIASFLAFRGFSYDTVRDVIRQLIEEQN